MKTIIPLLLLLVFLSACAAPAPTLPTPTIRAVEAAASATPAPALSATALLLQPPSPAVGLAPAACKPAPIVVPTKPAKIPGYVELDPDTNLHMTGTVQEIDLATYRLKVSGLVERPLSLTYDELRCLPKVTAHPLLVCAGFFQDSATWAGASLRAVLELAGVKKEARFLNLVSADQFETSLPLEQALLDENYLAYEWEGKPLPILHGFPLRAVFPAQPGGIWVKWLVELRLN